MVGEKEQRWCAVLLLLASNCPRARSRRVGGSDGEIVRDCDSDCVPMRSAARETSGERATSGER